MRRVLVLGFLPCRTETGLIDPLIETVGNHRKIRARKDLQGWLSRVGLPYHSPHKFRHGHAVYALKNAKDVSAWKAVSKNLMHANLSITDGVYGILSESDVKDQIVSLGQMMTLGVLGDSSELIVTIEKLLEQLKKTTIGG